MNPGPGAPILPLQRAPRGGPPWRTRPRFRQARRPTPPPPPRRPHAPVATSATRRAALENTPSLPVAAPAHTPPSTVRKERVGVLARVCAQDLISAFGLGGLGPGAIQSLLLLLSSVPARRLAPQGGPARGLR